MKNEMYIIINSKTGNLVKRPVLTAKRDLAVKYGDVDHDEYGLTRMIDVLQAMGYTIESYKYATAKKASSMGRDLKYDLDDLKMVTVDCDAGTVR